MLVFSVASWIIMSRYCIIVLICNQLILMNKVSSEHKCFILSNAYQNNNINGEWLSSNFRPNTSNFRLFDLAY